MKRFPICTFCTAILGFACLLSQNLLAQNAGAGGLEIATVEGILEAVAGDKIKVKTEDGTEYFAVLGRQSTMRYSGTADARFLKPGLLVRFAATFDVQQGTVISPVSEIEVFRTVKQRRMSQEQRQNQTPGIYPITGDKGSNKKGGRGENKKDAAKKNTKPINQNQGGTIQNFKVVGQLRAVQQKKLQVVVGNRPIIVDLDENATISVAAGDATFCQQGDQIHITGLRNPATKNLIQAETVEIVGAKPLGITSKNASNGQAKPPNRRSRTKRGKLGEDEPEKPAQGKK